MEAKLTNMSCVYSSICFSKKKFILDCQSFGFHWIYIVAFVYFSLFMKLLLLFSCCFILLHATIFVLHCRFDLSSLLMTEYGIL